MNTILLLYLISLSINFNTMNVVDCTKLKFDKEERAYLISEENLYTGKCETFHGNGFKAIENNYKDGLLHGDSFIWHETGKLKLRSKYANSDRIGKFISYYTNGNIESETEYGNNERIISMIQYDKNGKVLMKFGE